jgi:hypothetical protein
MKRLLGPVLLVLGLLAAGCGGGDGGPSNPDGGGGGNTFTATIDGEAWSAAPNVISVTAGGTPRDGTLLITGVESPSGVALALMIGFIAGPATQPLGVNPLSTPGGSASVGGGGDGWITPMNGAAGFVTITTRTDKRIAGTFNFTAAHFDPAHIPANLMVTAGAFDITVDAGLPPLPTGVGSTAIATIGGAPWNGATIIGLQPTPGAITIQVDNTAYSISLNSAVPVSAGGTYGIPSQISMMVSRSGTPDAWWGGLGADIGTLTIATLDGNRLIADFSATLPSMQEEAPLAVTGGAINVYMQQ